MGSGPSTASAPTAPIAEFSNTEVASVKSEVLVVSHTTREDRTRIISARHATKAERRNYMNKKTDEIRDKDDLRPEYDFDFTKGVRGKYYTPKNTTTVLMRIDPDVSRHFHTAEQLNAALRALIAEGRVPESA